VTRRFRPDIEGLRAVAILLVVLYHVGVPGIRGGFVGVDVFFVISGFLITNHLYGEVRETGRISFRRFYARRVRRLVPAASIVAALAVLGSWMWLNYLDAKSASIDAIWTTFFGLNVRLAEQGVNYQANTDPSPLQHYWSLAVEEQFYVIWPALVAILTWWWARRTTRNGHPWMLTFVLVVIVGASLAWCIYETTANEPAGYFLMPSRAWELGVGGLIALFAKQLERLPKRIAAPLSLAGLATLLLAGVWFTANTVFPGYAALMPVLGAAAVIVGGMRWQTGAEWVLKARPLQRIGGVSYGWYLWHWPLLILLPGFLHSAPTLLQKIVVALFGLWLASATSIAYESPLRTMRQFSNPRRSFVLGGSFASVVFVAVVMAHDLAPVTVATGPSLPSVQPRAGVSMLPAIEAGLKISRVPRNLTPAPTVISKDTPKIPWAGGTTCMADLQAVAVKGSCRTIDTAGTTKVVLAGDSHAEQWAPDIEMIAKQRGWALTVIAKSGCPLYKAEVFSTDFNRPYTECTAWRKSAMARIAQINPDLIVVSAFVGTPHGIIGNTQSWRSGVKITLNALKAQGAPVVVIQDTPWPIKDVPKCILAHLAAVKACDFPAVQPLRDAARMASTVAAAKEVGATVIDPTSWFCSKARCPVIIGNTPVYHDQTHVTNTYISELEPLLAAVLPSPRTD
jgi:peptidoglycan/LPS O-acetylase OafA/YrhL